MVNAVAIDQIGVRQKPIVRRKKFVVHWWMFVAAAVMLTIAVTFGYDLYFGRLGIIYPQPVIEERGAIRIIKVPPGGHVQAAIELALSGDIVELQAGAVYSGEVKLPNKPLTDFVTIQSSAIADLPPDKRVRPAQRSSMPTLTSGMLGKPAVSAANGAHHYRFVGIEFTPRSSGYNYALVQFGNGESPDNLPHDLEIDRSYLHPLKTGTVRRAIALNSATTTIKNSYIEGIGFPGEETQGICGWTGTRNALILNNYIEGGAENIMFGGADPSSPLLTPTDIEIRGNHLNKPAAWQKNVTVKTLFELKNAKRVQLIGNLLTNNWGGSAFRITVRNQDNGAPFSTIEDVIIKENVVDGSGDGINILGRDDTHPSQTLMRLTIENNLFLNISGEKEFGGSGYFIMISDGEGVTIANNTIFNSGNITTFYGTMPRDFIFRNNIVGHGDYGIHGLFDKNWAVGQRFFQNNLIMNLNRIPESDYSFPPGNTFVTSASDVGFMDASARDYRLSPSSKFKGKGREGRDIGANLSPSMMGLGK
ncbi:MAG: NosD domain-containing protein [Pyrinomonadaceae bacterium]